jgi:hypothetical protein
LLSTASAASPPAARGAIAGWPERSKELAEALIQKYGLPDGVREAQLSWTRARPWAEVVVYRDALACGRPNGFEQSVAYEVPVGKWRELDALDRGVDYDPVARELVAHTDRETTNFLALNLADEVIRGRRTAAQAREFYDRTLALSSAGKSSSYMRRLLFRPDEPRAGDAPSESPAQVSCN